MSRSWVVVLAVAALQGACAPALVPVEPRPVVVEPPPPAVVPAAPLVVAADPRLVRCGVDDGPRALRGEEDGSDSRRAKRIQIRQQGPRIQKPMPLTPPMPPPDPRPLPPLPLPPPPPPEARIEVGTITASPGQDAPRGVGLETIAATRSSLQYEACRPHLTGPDAGPHPLELELATSGAAMTVRLPNDRPSAFARCLAEQTCHARGAPRATSVTLLVPVTVAFPPPLEPPVPVDVVYEPTRDAGTSLATAVRLAFARAAQACVKGSTVAARAQVRVAIDLASSAPTVVRAANARILAPGGLDDDALGCVISSVTAVRFAASKAPRAANITLTFKP